MKLKLLATALENILGACMEKQEPRADLYLTEHHLSISLVMTLLGVGMGVSYFFLRMPALLFIGAAIALLGVAGLMCWRNQTIRVISDEEFEYTTFLGHTRVYAFSQITALRRNRDSFTLFLGSEKVHIESGAVMSDRLKELLQQAFVPREE